jgi:hypothetical protein
MSERSWRNIQAVCPDAEINRIRGPHMLLQVSPAECWVAIQRFLGQSERSPLLARRGGAKRRGGCSNTGQNIFLLGKL